MQCVESEIDFVDDTYRALRGRTARRLREDFSGTANTACEWVRRRRTNRAVAVDRDPEVLEWGRRHHVAELGRGARRIELIRGDVIRTRTEPVDITLAMNFSYWLFQERAGLRRYFRSVLRNLAPNGVFFLDAYGGYDACRVTCDRVRHDRFTYLWEQAEYDPISGRMLCHIHFRFPDGSAIRKAFSYEWRLWTLPELRELLHEAGFTTVQVYWQGWDEETGEADGNFEPVETGTPDATWIAYIAALK